jgi:hypothetical protein
VYGFVHDEAQQEQRTNEHEYLNGIKERGHDERHEQQPVHHQQRHAAVVADEIVPVPAQECDHPYLLNRATRTPIGVTIRPCAPDILK